MKKIIFMLIAFLMASHNASANLTAGVEKWLKYPEITFYHDCDSLSTIPNKGDTTVWFGAASRLHTTIPPVGTGSWEVNLVYGAEARVTIADVVDSEENFRFGFYFQYKSTGTITYLIEANNNANDLYIRLFYPSQNLLGMGGLNADFWSTALVPNGLYFIEVAVIGDTAKIYVNGSLRTTRVGGYNPNLVYIQFGDGGGEDYAGHVDQIMFTNDVNLSLYPYRDLTDIGG